MGIGLLYCVARFSDKRKTDRSVDNQPQNVSNMDLNKL